MDPMALLDSVLGSMKTAQPRIDFEKSLAAMRLDRGARARSMRTLRDIFRAKLTLRTSCACGWSKTWSWASLARDHGADAALAAVRPACLSCGAAATVTEPVPNPRSRH